MNQLFAAGIGTVLALILWGLGRKPKTPDDKRASTGLDMSQIALVSSGPRSKEQTFPHDSCSSLVLLRTNLHDQLKVKKKLKKLISSGPEE